MHDWFKYFVFNLFIRYLTAVCWREDIRQVKMDQPFLMFRTTVTSDVIHGIKVEEEDDSIYNVTEETNTVNGSDESQVGTTYDMDPIKEERKSPKIDDIDVNNSCDNIDYNEKGMSQTMDDIGESFTGDRNDIKEETYDYIKDIKEETYDYIKDIKEETYDYIKDIKEEGISENMDDRENDSHDNIHINESQNMNNIPKSYSCVGIEIKAQDTGLHVDGIKEEGMYHLSGNVSVM